MAIKDVQPKSAIETLEGEITEIGQVREFQKFGKPGRVCTARIKDESGDCNLSLWNEQIDQVKVGDKVKIENGYASDWQGDVQVSTGRNGTLNVISSSEASTEESTEETPAEDESSEEEKADEPAEEVVEEKTDETAEAVEEEKPAEEVAEEPVEEAPEESTEEKTEEVTEEKIN